MGRDCVLNSGRTICNHIRHFYDNPHGEAAIYFEFSKPADWGIEQIDGPKGDKCHHNLIEVPRKQRRKLMKDAPLSDYKICNSGDREALTEDKAIQLKDLMERKQLSD